MLFLAVSAKRRLIGFLETVEHFLRTCPTVWRKKIRRHLFLKHLVDTIMTLSFQNCEDQVKFVIPAIPLVLCPITILFAFVHEGVWDGGGVAWG